MVCESLQTPRSAELIGSDGLLISQLAARATSEHTHACIHTHTLRALGTHPPNKLCFLDFHNVC